MSRHPTAKECRASARCLRLLRFLLVSMPISVLQPEQSSVTALPQLRCGGWGKAEGSTLLFRAEKLPGLQPVAILGFKSVRTVDILLPNFCGKIVSPTYSPPAQELQQQVCIFLLFVVLVNSLLQSPIHQMLGNLGFLSSILLLLLLFFVAWVSEVSSCSGVFSWSPEHHFSS